MEETFILIGNIGMGLRVGGFRDGVGIKSLVLNMVGVSCALDILV